VALTGEEIAFILSGDDDVVGVWAHDDVERVFVNVRRNDQPTLVRIGCLLRRFAPHAVIDVEYFTAMPPHLVRRPARRIVLTPAGRTAAEQMLALRR
jgi:hypothetical protein